jgi:hypothetical protein
MSEKIEEIEKIDKIMYTQNYIINDDKDNNNKDSESYEEYKDFLYENYYQNMLDSLKNKMLEYLNKTSLPLCEYLSKKKLDVFIKENIKNDLDS